MKVLEEGAKVGAANDEAPNRLLWVFFAAYFTFGIVLNVVGVIIPVLIKQYGLSLFAGGLLAFAFYISFGVFSIPAGWAADRIGSKPVVLGGVFLMGVGCAAIPWANGYGAIHFWHSQSGQASPCFKQPAILSLRTLTGARTTIETLR